MPSASWHYISTLAYIQFTPKREIAYHNYKIALVSSYLSPQQQFKSLSDSWQILPRRSKAVWVGIRLPNNRLRIESHSSLLIFEIKNANHIDLIWYRSIHRSVSIISMYWPNLNFVPLIWGRVNLIIKYYDDKTVEYAYTKNNNKTLSI